jgi:hypothetical protein
MTANAAERMKKMVYLIAGLVLTVGLSVILAPDHVGGGMEEFCRLECGERKIRDRSVCC